MGQQQGQEKSGSTLQSCLSSTPSSPHGRQVGIWRGDEDNQAAGYDHPEDQGETAAAGQSETGGVLTSEATQQCIYVVVFYDEKSKLSSL